MAVVFIIDISTPPVAAVSMAQLDDGTLYLATQAAASLNTFTGDFVTLVTNNPKNIKIALRVQVNPFSTASAIGLMGSVSLSTLSRLNAGNPNTSPLETHIPCKIYVGQSYEIAHTVTIRWVTDYSAHYHNTAVAYGFLLEPYFFRDTKRILSLDMMYEVHLPETESGGAAAIGGGGGGRGERNKKAKCRFVVTGWMELRCEELYGTALANKKKKTKGGSKGVKTSPVGTADSGGGGEGNGDEENDIEAGEDGSGTIEAEAAMVDDPTNIFSIRVGAGTHFIIQHNSIEVTEAKQKYAVGTDVVIGMDALYESLYKRMELVRDERFRKEHAGLEPPKTFILYGSPGSGKKFLVKTLAKHLGFNPPRVFDGLKLMVSGAFGDTERSEVSTTMASKGMTVFYIDKLEYATQYIVGGQEEAVKRDAFYRWVHKLLEKCANTKNCIVIGGAYSRSQIASSFRGIGCFMVEEDIPKLSDANKVELLSRSLGSWMSDKRVLKEIAPRLGGFTGGDCVAFAEYLTAKLLNGVSVSSVRGGGTIPDLTLDLIKSTLKIFRPPSINYMDISEIPDDENFGNRGYIGIIAREIKETLMMGIAGAELCAALKIKPTKGILLYGPPGCGKTALVREVARMGSFRVISVKGPELLSSYLGASEEAIRRVFAKARQSAPCIIFFDEFDAIAKARGGGGGGDKQEANAGAAVVQQLLTEMDGFSVGKESVVVFAATNDPNALDSAIKRPGRLDVLCPVYPPDPAVIYSVAVKELDALFSKITRQKVVHRMKENLLKLANGQGYKYDEIDHYSIDEETGELKHTPDKSVTCLSLAKVASIADVVNLCQNVMRALVKRRVTEANKADGGFDKSAGTINLSDEEALFVIQTLDSEIRQWKKSIPYDSMVNFFTVLITRGEKVKPEYATAILAQLAGIETEVSATTSASSGETGVASDAGRKSMVRSSSTGGVGGGGEGGVGTRSLLKKCSADGCKNVAVIGCKMPGCRQCVGFCSALCSETHVH